MSRISAHLARLRRRHALGESGFSLIELVVATGVMAMVMSGLAWLGTVAFTDAAVARNRQTATALTNQALEQVRALSYDIVRRGLRTADLATSGDPAVTFDGTTYYYDGEQIPHGAIVQDVAPLAPYRTHHVIDGVTYTLGVYVTYADNDLESKVLRVTAAASWESSLRPGVNKFVEAQTLVHSPLTVTTCEAQISHPYPSPCQPYLYSSAQRTPAGITIRSRSDLPAINGIMLQEAALWLPTAGSNMELEQISAVAANAATSAVGLKVLNVATQAYGPYLVNTAADNDPSQPKPEYSSACVGAAPCSAPASASASASGSGNTLTLASQLALDTASAASAVSASAASACTNTAGDPQLDSRPCGIATARQGASLSASMSLAASLGSVTLASMAGPGSGTPSVKAHTNREVTSGNLTACSYTNGDGCVHASAVDTVGAVGIGGIPAVFKGLGLLPVSADYLIELSGFTRSVRAEAGEGTLQPAATLSNPVLTYWSGVTLANPGGYTSVTLTGASSGTISVAPINVSLPLGAATLRMSAEIRTGTATAAACTSTCELSRADVESPIIGDVYIEIVSGGVSILDLVIHVDLGTLMAQASYFPSDV